MRDPIFRNSKAFCGVAAVVVAIFSLFSIDLYAQDTTKPEPDVVVFANGEKLIGHFEGLVGGTAKFKSDTVGEVTVDLSKVQELRTSQKFAVIKKDLRLGKDDANNQIPQGTITVTNQKVEVEPGNGRPAQTFAVGDLGNVIDEASFQDAFHHPGFFEKWKGAATLGTSLVEATQNSLNVNTAINLVRAIPSENWLDPRNRTIVDFTQAYGVVTQPGDPTLKTSIYHADAERDEYFTPKLYALGAVAFDHNFSQGLNLQQMYGGGIGWTAIENAKQTLDFKGTVDYEKQSFQPPSVDQNLIDSIFSETYHLKLAHGILFQEELSANPAWSNTSAYSAFGTIGVTFPVYKRFGFTTTIIDSFLNNPPPGFKKNSFQFTTGLTYTLP